MVARVARSGRAWAAGAGNAPTKASRASHSAGVEVCAVPPAALAAARAVGGLGMTGHFQSHLDRGGSRLNSRRLAVWAFQPNRPIRPSSSRLTRPLIRGQLGCQAPSPRRRLDRCVGNAVEQSRAEERRRIALGRTEGDRALTGQHRLAQTR